MFPMFVSLEGKTVLLVGPVGAAKGEKLAAFGARLVRAGGFRQELLDLDPALVIAAGPDSAVTARCCRARRIPVNTVDDPENCDFYFPALVRRGGVTLGICTGGASPALAGELARRAEELLPEEEVLVWLSELTRRLRSSIPDPAVRGPLLRRITQAAMAKNRPLTDEEMENC